MSAPKWHYDYGGTKIACGGLMGYVVRSSTNINDVTCRSCQATIVYRTDLHRPGSQYATGGFISKNDAPMIGER